MDSNREQEAVFISPDLDEGGSVRWHIQPYKNTKDSPRMGCVLSITDCYRTIGLSFYCDSDEMYKERLQKLDNLISSLTRMKAAYKRSWKVANKLHKEAKKNNDVTEEDDG